MFVCGIELDMLVPIVEKKLLKALEISKLSVLEAPFTDISEIVELVGLRWQPLSAIAKQSIE